MRILMLKSLTSTLVILSIVLVFSSFVSAELTEERAEELLAAGDVDTLLSYLGSQDVGSGFLAAHTIAMLGEEAITHLNTYLQSRDDWARVQAVYALGEIGSVQALTPLLQCLEDDYIEVRLEAIKSLAKIKDSRAIPYLSNLAKNGNQEERKTVCMALGSIGGQQALTLLLNFLGDNSDMVGEAAASSIAANWGESAFTFLISLLRMSENPDQKRNAAKSLALIGDPRAIPYLIEARDNETVPDNLRIYNTAILDLQNQ